MIVPTQPGTPSAATTCSEKCRTCHGRPACGMRIGSGWAAGRNPPRRVPYARDRRGGRAAPTHRDRDRVAVRIYGGTRGCCRSCCRPRPCNRSLPARGRAELAPMRYRNNAARTRTPAAGCPKRAPAPRGSDRWIARSLARSSPSLNVDWALPPRMSPYRYILLFEHGYGWRMRHRLGAKTANCVATMSFHPGPAGCV